MRQLKRGSIYIMTLFLLVPMIAFAESYSLVMGQAEAVCKHMLHLFNEDLKNFGELKYDQHEEFTAIEWTLTLDDFCWRAHMAQFDIDNDGHEDVVLKHAACIRGRLNDSLYIYAEGKNAPKSPPYFTSNVDVLKQASGRIGLFAHGAYELRKFPKFREGKNFFYHEIGAPFHMNPFRFGGTYYIVMDDPYQQPYKGGKRHTAIVRYEKSGNLTDVCYLATRDFIRSEPDVLD